MNQEYSGAEESVFSLPPRTSERLQTRSGLTGGLDGRIELSADVVDALLCLLDVVLALLSVALAQQLLCLLEVGAKDVDVVQPAGSNHRLRVALDEHQRVGVVL